VTDLSSIGTADALADWLNTGPDYIATAHAFDQLVQDRGFDDAMTIWRQAHGTTDA
jgi:hypothetical protein